MRPQRLQASGIEYALIAARLSATPPKIECRGSVLCLTHVSKTAKRGAPPPDLELASDTQVPAFVKSWAPDVRHPPSLCGDFGEP